MFHETYPDVGIELDVRRHPYSFNADNNNNYGKEYPVGPNTVQGQEPTWHESLLDYCGGSSQQRSIIEESMASLGKRVGIALNYNVRVNWQPVDSQRAMLWASSFGQQEEFMDELAKRHFELGQSASHRTTILDAAKSAGLDVEALASFLDTDELKAHVWKSYGTMIRNKGIRAIPFFVFGLPDHKSVFHPHGKSKSFTVRGSADPNTFFSIFESLHRQLTEERASTGDNEV
mmetsp:Transcript_22355/g.28922  ORF Transcript_22355/g.28922 Transcript_22355/m.28922 type:complete len:232 (-) Transcript_22355:294-989(-)|eukprot:CAMPEP_0197296208 /NCGR_PEP_ID=MMETSP0890-20130614/37758_1 /TAXON_ID=44058 ORGANISM="Aureoumbra lagunensis, Strain CCMP1510" /NCGR_SAMPLE_ID=MMETSP0890 /ASSEMBLY_ACC=CAM_ASM_000533 /LENGTH=231 /DNA_ID=CAMNT_0042772629 /DNA_START=109 /DNA_END=804 /DNA_ORIENTATION=+